MLAVIVTLIRLEVTTNVRAREQLARKNHRPSRRVDCSRSRGTHAVLGRVEWWNMKYQVLVIWGRLRPAWRLWRWDTVVSRHNGHAVG